MKYKIKTRVVVKVEVPFSGNSKILTKEPAVDSKVIEKEFIIVAVNEQCQLYTIIIDDNMNGWIISQFHIKHCNVNPKYLGKKFYDITEPYVLKAK